MTAPASSAPTSTPSGTAANAPLPYATLLAFSRYVDRPGPAKATFVGGLRKQRAIKARGLGDRLRARGGAKGDQPRRHARQKAQVIIGFARPFEGDAQLRGQFGGVNGTVLYDPALPAGVLDVKETLPVAARALRLTVQPWEARDGNGFEKAFAALNKNRPDGIYVLGGGLIRANGKRIAGLALKSRLPSTYFLREPVDAGGLMHYGVDVTNSYRRVAYFVDKILKGAKPADLPVEQPTKFEFIINLKAAKQIGLMIPPNVLARANRVIR